MAPKKSSSSFGREMVMAGQTDLFHCVSSSQKGADPTPANIAPDIEYKHDFLEDHEALFHYLLHNLNWNTQFKSRETAMFGVSYGYDGQHYRYAKLPDFLSPLADNIKATFGYLPNSALVNHYPNGDHYISYHSDKNMEMNQHTGVAIVSLGSIREMAFRNIQYPHIKSYFALQPGSAMYMDDVVQQVWQHGILKTQSAKARISISFRSLVIR